MVLNFQTFVEQRGMEDLLQPDRLMPIVLEKWRGALNKYAPYREGYLIGTSYSEWDGLDGGVVYPQVYARRVYEGDHFNFRKDMNPNAQAHWDRAAEKNSGEDIRNFILAYLRSLE
jgi:hypothetical protein